MSRSSGLFYHCAVWPISNVRAGYWVIFIQTAGLLQTGQCSVHLPCSPPPPAPLITSWLLAAALATLTSSKQCDQTTARHTLGTPATSHVSRVTAALDI